MDNHKETVSFKKINDLLPKSTDEWIEEFMKKHGRKSEEEFSKWLNK